MNRHGLDITILWLLSFGSSLTVVTARLGLALFAVSQVPPVEPELLERWKRRRTYLMVSELCALPAFATAGVTATVYWDLPPIASVLIAMVLGALGFGFLMHAVETIVRKRLEMDQ